MKRLLVFFLFLIFIQCSGNALKRSAGNLTWGYTGWGIDPENIQNPIIPTGKEKLDWFYMIAPGKALSRSIEINSPSFMESTCKLSAVKDNQNKLLEETLASVNLKVRTDADLRKKGEEILKDTEKGTALCRPTGEAEKYTTCDCVIFLKYDGGKQALSEKLK